MCLILKKLKRLMKIKEKKIVPSNPNGLYSVREAAETLGMTMSKVYHAIYKKKLNFTQNGSIYVLHIDDLKSYEETLRKSPTV